MIIQKVNKMIGESVEGSFGILPKHIDFVTKIVPCILIYDDEQGEGFIGVDEGILVKQQDEIRISVREAIAERKLENLRTEMEKKFMQIEEEETKTRQEMTKLELGIVKSFYDLKKLE